MRNSVILAVLRFQAFVTPNEREQREVKVFREKAHPSLGLMYRQQRAVR